MIATILKLIFFYFLYTFLKSLWRAYKFKRFYFDNAAFKNPKTDYSSRPTSSKQDIEADYRVL